MQAKLKIISISLLSIILIPIGLVYIDTSLYGLSPIPVTWNEPVEIPILPDHDIYCIRVIQTSTEVFIFFLTSESSSNNTEIYYITSLGDSWSAHLSLDITFEFENTSLSTSGFDVVYDNNTNMFHFFVIGTCLEISNIFYVPGSLESCLQPHQITNYTSNSKLVPMHPRACINTNADIYVTYNEITGLTENLNNIMLVHHAQDNWNKPEYVGIGNQPCIYADSNGQIGIYSNLITYKPSPQYCVDEWVKDSSGWKKNPITTSAINSNTSPLVIGDTEGTKYLFYDYREYSEAYCSTYRLLMQTQALDNPWSQFITIIENDQPKSSICAFIVEKTINLYYIDSNSIFSLRGIIS